MRTPQRPQPVFDPNRVCVHFAFCCHECTHFAWISLLYHLTLPAQTRGAHTVLGTVVLLYIYTVVQSLFTLYNCTLASTSLASVLSTNHRRALIYLLCSDWSIRCPLEPELNHSMLTTSFPKGNGRGTNYTRLFRMKV